jgi:O-antigen ligase
LTLLNQARLSRILSVGVLGIVLGYTISVLGSAFGFLLIAGVTVILVIAATRHALVKSHVACEVDHLSDDADQYKISRRLYFVGTLLIAQLTFRPVLSFTLSDWLFLGSVVALVPSIMRDRRRLDAGDVLILLGVLLFAVSGVISSIARPLPATSLGFVARFVYLTVVWFWLATKVLRTPSHIETALRLWTISTAISGAAAIVQVTAGNVIPGTEIVWGRMTGFSQHVNDLGGATSVAAVPALALSTEAKGALRTLGSFVVLLLIIAGLILSGSVGSLVAATVGFVIWVAITPLKLRVMALLFAVSLGIAVTISFQQAMGLPSPTDRVAKVTAPDDPAGTLWSRLATDQLAWNAIQRDPLVGAGFDVESNAETGGLIHNSILGAWYGAGLGGFIGIVLIFGCISVMGLVAVRRSPSDSTAVSAAVLSAFVVFLVFSMGTPGLYSRYGWISGALILAIRAQQQRKIPKVLESGLARIKFANPQPVTAISPHVPRRSSGLSQGLE